MHKVLVLNLGATSSKVSVFEDAGQLMEKTIRHTVQDMEEAPTNREQVEMRVAMIREWMDTERITFEEIDAVGMRGGGMTRATVSGTYEMNEVMREDAYKLYVPDGNFIHGSRIVLPVLDGLLDGKEIPIYVTDPPYVDELCEEAKLSGTPAFTRLSRFQVLNHKQVGRQAAADLGKAYEDINIVIAHMGGGVSVGAHRKGRVIDVNDCTDGDGPFSPERSGGVPEGQLITACFSGKYSEKEVRAMIRGNGGFKGYLGTTDIREVEKMAAEGNEKADLVFRAFIYQVSKEIGGCVAGLKGQVDGIILTGGIAYSDAVVSGIREYVGSFAPVYVYAGEGEAEALVNGALRILKKEARPIEYV